MVDVGVDVGGVDDVVDVGVVNVIDVVDDVGGSDDVGYHVDVGNNDFSGAGTDCARPCRSVSAEAL